MNIQISYLKNWIKKVSLFSAPPPYYYEYARKNIPCDCPLCSCPYRNKMKYCFAYIHEDKKIIFYNVPKAASTFFRKKLFDKDQKYSLTNPKMPLDNYFKFSFIRNPWDRLVSNWKMFTSRPFRIRQLKSMTDKDLSSFEDFVYFARENHNHHWQPQHLFLPKDLDFIGRLESFHNDVNEITNRIGIQPFDTTKKENQTDHLPYQHYYSTSLIDKVAEMYSEEINRFKYTFE